MLEYIFVRIFSETTVGLTCVDLQYLLFSIVYEKSVECM